MNIDGFWYKLWYIVFPIDSINLKIAVCTHTVKVNVCIKFEVIWIK